MDGELVIFVGDRLSFDALQQRMEAGAHGAGHLAKVQPASVVAFDLLRQDGEDLTGLPWRQRRTVVEVLAGGWRPYPNCPVRADPAALAPLGRTVPTGQPGSQTDTTATAQHARRPTVGSGTLDRASVEITGLDGIGEFKWSSQRLIK